MQLYTIAVPLPVFPYLIARGALKYLLHIRSATHIPLLHLANPGLHLLFHIINDAVDNVVKLALEKRTKGSLDAVA